MLRPDIQAGAATWIAELRLQDRIITVRYTKNLCDAFGNPVYGLMTIQNLDEGRFLIEVQDPETWPVGGSRVLTEQSIEEVYVHELVHIRWIDLTAHNPDPAVLVQEERATWATARALVRANSTTRAAMVRAMVAQTAAMRRQTKGTAMDAQAVIAALKEADGEAALKILGDYVAEQLGGANGPPSVKDPAVPPMGADVGNEPKDKPPMNMGDKPEQYARAMKAELAEVRAMKVELKSALDLARPAAKTEIVRGMRADTIALTPAQEKMILDAKTLEEAKTLERGMRATLPTGPARKQHEPPNGGNDGLTATQRARVAEIDRTNPARAMAYRAECVKENKKGGAK